MLLSQSRIAPVFGPIIMNFNTPDLEIDYFAGSTLQVEDFDSMVIPVTVLRYRRHDE
jgi:hypothetical protein